MPWGPAGSDRLAGPGHFPYELFPLLVCRDVASPVMSQCFHQNSLPKPPVARFLEAQTEEFVKGIDRGAGPYSIKELHPVGFGTL